jgi:hypothetical protein
MRAIGALGAVPIQPAQHSMRDQVGWIVENPGIDTGFRDDLLGIGSQIP